MRYIFCTCIFASLFRCDFCTVVQDFKRHPSRGPSAVAELVNHSDRSNNARDYYRQSMLFDAAKRQTFYYVTTDDTERASSWGWRAWKRTAVQCTACH